MTTLRNFLANADYVKWAFEAIITGGVAAMIWRLL